MSCRAESKHDFFLANNSTKTMSHFDSAQCDIVFVPLSWDLALLAAGL
jgi:hypothetical protein